MVEVSRRSFLKGFLAVTAVAVAGLPLGDIPTLYGDGIHDDTEALQAMFDRKPFKVDGQALTATDGELSGGRFLISRTVVIQTAGWDIHDCTFTRADDFRVDVDRCEHDCLIYVPHEVAQTSQLRNLTTYGSQSLAGVKLLHDSLYAA